MRNPCKNCAKGITVSSGEKRTISTCSDYPRECKKRKKYNEFMESRRKFKKTNVLIKSFEELEKQEYVWYLNRTVNVKFLLNLPYKALKERLETGLYKVKKK